MKKLCLTAFALLLIPGLIAQAEVSERVEELQKAIEARQSAFATAKEFEDKEARNEKHEEAREKFWERVDELYGPESEDKVEKAAPGAVQEVKQVIKTVEKVVEQIPEAPVTIDFGEQSVDLSAAQVQEAKSIFKQAVNAFFGLFR